MNKISKLKKRYREDGEFKRLILSIAITFSIYFLIFMCILIYTLFIAKDTKPIGASTIYVSMRKKESSVDKNIEDSGRKDKKSKENKFKKRKKKSKKSKKKISNKKQKEAKIKTEKEDFFDDIAFDEDEIEDESIKSEIEKDLSQENLEQDNEKDSIFDNEKIEAIDSKLEKAENEEQNREISPDGEESDIEQSGANLKSDITVDMQALMSARKIERKVDPDLSGIDIAGRKNIKLIVEFDILPSGVLSNVVVVNSSGSIEVDRKVEQALRLWKFAATSNKRVNNVRLIYYVKAK